MPADVTDRFFLWMETHNVKRPAAAAMLGVDERSLSTYRSRGLPQKKVALAERIMSEPPATSREEQDNKINVSFTDEEFELVQRASLIVQTTFKDFLRRATITKAQEEIRRQRSQALKVADDPASYGKKDPTGTEGN